MNEICDRPLRNSFMPSRRQSLQTASVCLATSEPPSRDQTRRRLGGRQPLWGIGVTSLIDFTSSPAAWRARIDDSRPAPGPLTASYKRKTIVVTPQPT